MPRTNTGKRVVVITTHGDAHVPFVQHHLKQPLIEIDPQDLLIGKELTFILKRGEIVVVSDGATLTNVSGVWYRKPQPFFDETPVEEAYKKYSENALERLFMQCFTAFKDAVWVSSDYYTMHRANNKSLQLAIASKLGFSVPDTVITSNTNEAKQFIAKHKRCISKPLATIYPKIAGEQKILLTTLIDDHFQPNLERLCYAPSIFQEAIDEKQEARVIVVGDKAFAAFVRSESTENSDAVIKRVQDNKLGLFKGKLHVEIAKNFPKKIADLCIAHTKALGLRFGALDIMLDKKGTWWFLENNPNGQWAYVEHATDQPIGKSIASVLTGKD